jgi:hypothetical protein
MVNSFDFELRIIIIRNVSEHAFEHKTILED